MGREPPCQPEEQNFWNGRRSAEAPVPGAGNDRAVFLVSPMRPSRILAVMLLLRVAGGSYTTEEGGLIWGRMCRISLVREVLTGPSQFSVLGKGMTNPSSNPNTTCCDLGANCFTSLHLFCI